MIPKKIHYCWFGTHPLPETALAYIQTWRQCLPDYEIKLWNEDNFDINQFDYTQKAYHAKKYAFVADVCRIQALYQEGGLYLDTDIEVIQSFDSFLNQVCFTGFEEGFNPYTQMPTCNPQAGAMGAVSKSQFMFDILKVYQQQTFDLDHLVTINTIFKKVYEQHQIKLNNQLQRIQDYVTIYPSDYFIAKNAYTLKLAITKNTICIHHYDGSWLEKQPIKQKLKRLTIKYLSLLLGAKKAQFIIEKLKK